MGIFTTVGALFGSRGRKVARAQMALENEKADFAEKSALRAQEYRKLEDPREHAHLKQTAFARGLGKSSIEVQDRERLTMQQSQRNEMIAHQLKTARLYKEYLKKKRKYDKYNKYAQLLDSIIGVVGGVSFGPEGQAPGSGGGDNYQSGNYDWGGSGDYTYGGNSQWG